MAFETKVILKSIGELIKRSSSLKEAYDLVADLAAADGVSMAPYEDKSQPENKEQKEDIYGDV